MNEKKDPISIRVLDPDPERGAVTADTLRRLAREQSLQAEIWSVGCFLEIARWGLTGQTPALLVDGHTICSGGPISDGMLQRLVQGLLKMQAGTGGGR